MTDSPPDEVLLRATEERMRHALGLRCDAPERPTFDHSTTTINGSQPQRRRFVRDGEVPVTIISRDHHQDDGSGSNQLDETRQAIRSQAVAREHAERLLAEAQTSVRALQTALAHERLAKDEVGRWTDAGKRAAQTVKVELVAERQARQKVEDALRDAQATITNLSAKLHEAQRALTAAKAELAAERRKGAEAIRAQTVAPATHA